MSGTMVPPRSEEFLQVGGVGGEYAPLAEEPAWEEEPEPAWSQLDNPLVPLLDDHEPGCCGGLCPGESCERCGNFMFFFTMCTASLIATMATTALCIADTATIVTLYSSLAPEFEITKPQTGIGYHFNHTVNDLVVSSCVRTFLALTSHAASNRANLYRPYLYVSLIVTLVCTTHVALKAAFFDYVWVVDKWVAPLLFAVTVAACAGHVAVASSMSVHAAKTRRRHKNMRAGLLGMSFGADAGMAMMSGGDSGVSTNVTSSALYGHSSVGVDDAGAAGTEAGAGVGSRAPLLGGDSPAANGSFGGGRGGGLAAVSGSETEAVFAWSSAAGAGVYVGAEAGVGAGGGAAEGDAARGAAGALGLQDASASLDGDVPAEALADPDSRFMVVGGVKLHYKDVGGGSVGTTGYAKDSALVLIHGFGAGVFAWRRVGPALAAAHGMRVVALDRPGFGLSGRPDRGSFPESASPYSVTVQARLVEELCAALGITRAVFAGHADGCLVAMQAAVAGMPKSPGVLDGVRVRTAGLVLLSANASLDAAVPAPVRLLLNTSLGMSMLRPLLRSEIGEVANRRAWHDRSKLTRGVLLLYKRPLCIQGWDRALLEAARTRLGLTQRDISATLAALATVPVLMVTGANDVIAPPRRAVAVATELRQCMLKLLPRCGHLPHEESPEALLEALAPFVLEHLPRLAGATSVTVPVPVSVSPSSLSNGGGGMASSF